MERNKWETAIRCLEVAVHPHTSDDEVVAAVNGFRRTADGTPLSDVCIEFAAAEHDGRDPAATAEEIGGLSEENLDLRRKLARQQAGHVAALRRLHEAERLIHDLSAEIRAEEQSFADFRAASALVVEGLKDENLDLRGALEQARLTAERSEAPFRDFLAAALSQAPQSDASPPNYPPGPPRHPWTA
jgi:hypothetical protein